MYDIPVIPAQPRQNLCNRIGGGVFWLQSGLAAFSGALLALAFPPLELGMLAWVALVPLLLAPVPMTLGRRIWVGYLFGAVHFIISLWWLNTIGFCAGVLLGLICAFFPMAWYLLVSSLMRRMPGDDPAMAPNTRHPWDLSGFRQCLWMLAAAAAWVALEWVRSWFFTGFPWNQLGVSQWSLRSLLLLTTITGVYGISFLVVAVNIALAISWARFGRLFVVQPGRSAGLLSWPMAVAMLLVLPVFILIVTQKVPTLPDMTLRAGTIQGCLPQCRMWTQEQYDESLRVYSVLTREVASAGKPNLIVWPETAIPASFDDPAYAAMRERVFSRMDIPLLAGAIDRRPAVRDPRPDAADDWLEFNSAILLDGNGKRLQSYDKTHRVPFGEYTPFAKQLPWLERLIGMGRGLTPGREFTVFNLPNNVRGGVMICYEDAFPGIAREFTRRGADILVTLTNDSWYAESAGSRQHLLHAVFRAAENNRPLLRAGNNSDTCLILPDGRITSLVLDKRNGNRFIRAWTVLEVPVWRNQPLTWYAKHGDVFARACAGLAAACLLWIFFRVWRTRRAMLDKVAPPPK